MVLVTVPLLVGTLRGTTTMAMVADARGFGVSRQPRLAAGAPDAPRSTSGATSILVLLVVAALVLNHLHIGARSYG